MAGKGAGKGACHPVFGFLIPGAASLPNLQRYYNSHRSRQVIFTFKGLKFQ
jgi:hypothetical protein